MDAKLTICLRELSDSIVSFYKLILGNGDSQPIVGPHLIIPDVHDLFQAIHNDFEELYKPSTLSGALTILQYMIEGGKIAHVNMAYHIEELLLRFSSTEDEFKIIVQIYHQILNSLPNDFPHRQTYNDFIINKLTERDYIRNENLQPQLALCVLVLVEKFNITAPLEAVWRELHDHGSTIILVHYIPQLTCKLRVYESLKFWKNVEYLLRSGDRDNVKSAVFIIRHVLVFLRNQPSLVEVDGYFSWSKESSGEYFAAWSAYLTVVENLEEKQSHLILPSLELLKAVSFGKNPRWMSNLFRTLLGHSNKMVVRWTVGHLPTDFQNLVMDSDLLWSFLNATNNYWLYKDHPIQLFQLPVFESEADRNDFLKIFSEIHWKSLPMHGWLQRIRDIHCDTITNEVIVAIAIRIHNLQNPYIRMDCLHKFLDLFSTSIFSMDLKDLLQLLSALCNSSDTLPPSLLDYLLQILREHPRPYLTDHACELLADIGEDKQLILMDVFDRVPSSEHKWFGLLATLRFSRTLRQSDFCKQHYGIEFVHRELPLILNEHVSKLSWDFKSRSKVSKETVDWFTRTYYPICHGDYDHIEKLISYGGLETLLNIAQSLSQLGEVKNQVLDRMLIEFTNLTRRPNSFTKSFVNALIKACARSQCHEYAHRILDMDVTNNFVAYHVFRAVEDVCDFSIKESRELLMRGLLFGEPLLGELRQEYEYLFQKVAFINGEHKSTNEIRKICLEILSRLDDLTRESLREELIAKSKDMAAKKARYYENSKHHRIKLRIAQALDELNRLQPVWHDYYLSAVIDENNQTNVSYIYEYMAAVTVPEKVLMMKLGNLMNISSGGQTSLFAISYMYVEEHHVDLQFVDNLIRIFLPFTMGSVFNTRLYAQIAIYHIVKYSACKRYDWLKDSIEKALRESPNAYEKLKFDLRYNCCRYFRIYKTEPILYVTLVPEDEHLSKDLEYLEEFTETRKARMINLMKRCEQEEILTSTRLDIESVQRKMNPEINASHNSEHNSEMIVVASLIDKLPNLGGIARTCEVLGIRNLVVDSMRHVQNKDFKNLSMTAENWIKISEQSSKSLHTYLQGKKNEGYSVIGAEQTSKSVNFIDFKFPRRCVLLLGHEKEGIPADLLTLLDCAVEIPQFGMVRSLNVHVTGALFMYEYCKQHLHKPAD